MKIVIPKKSIRNLVGVGAAGAIVAAAVGLYNYVNREPDYFSTPEKTMETFLTSENNRDWNLYLDTVGERFIERLSVICFDDPQAYRNKNGRENLIAKLENAPYIPEQWQIESTQMTGENEAVVNIKTNFFDSIAYKVKSYKVKKYTDRWKVEEMVSVKQSPEQREIMFKEFAEIRQQSKSQDNMEEGEKPHTTETGLFTRVFDWFAGWKYTDEINSDRNNEYNYNFKNPKEVILAYYEAYNYGDSNLVLSLLTEESRQEIEGNYQMDKSSHNMGAALRKGFGRVGEIIFNWADSEPFSLSFEEWLFRGSRDRVLKYRITKSEKVKPGMYRFEIENVRSKENGNVYNSTDKFNMVFQNDKWRLSLES